MCSRFSNVYWSLDYKSGIDGLSNQSLRSLNQLHELRKLVFGYLNYYNANSEYLSKATRGIESPSSPFKLELGHEGNLRNRVTSRTVSQNRGYSNEAFYGTGHDEKPEEVNEEPQTFLLNDALEEHRRNMASESHRLFQLTTLIDREVLEGISQMLKHYEPQIRSILGELEKLLEDFESTYKSVEKLKKEYFEYVSLKDVSVSNLSKQGEEDIMPDESTTSVSEDLSFNEDNSDNESFDLETEFDFPLQVGSLKLSSPKELVSVMKDLINSIPTTKRQIPIPGYKNDIFSSESLCERLKSTRPLLFDPSRANIEKFGQSLLDLKLMIGSGFIGSKKFRCEKMWFEWSDLALYSSDYVSQSTDQNTSPTPLTPTKLSKMIMEDDKAKLVNHMAQNASQRFRGMFKTMRTTLAKGNDNEKLDDLSEKYSTNYLKLQTIKHNLETTIFQRSQAIDTFEKLKIQMIYQSLTKLHELIRDSTHHSSKAFESTARRFIKTINTPDNYTREYGQMLDHFSTGIYTPSLAAPDFKVGLSSIQSNNSFQNLKLSFNLYKDISLQVSLKDNVTEELLSHSSIPQFLYDLFHLIGDKSGEEDDAVEVTELWLSAFDHQSHWAIKGSILKQLANLNDLPSGEVSFDHESELTRRILKDINSSLSEFPLSSIVNFAKGWLLEVSDSVIPSTVFDSLMNIYKKNEIDESRKKELIKLLGTVPRSNLSSLVFILEHMSEVFGLYSIPCYGLSDDFPDELKQRDPDNKLRDISVKLNSMDMIGSLPFLHFICRPPPLKTSTGFKPPLDIYNDILNQLLDIDVRSALFEALVNNEKNYKMKNDQEKSGFPLKKIRQSSQTTDSQNNKDNLAGSSLDASLVKSPSYTNSETFSLRPFKTKATPVPSPSASPRPISKDTSISSGDFTSGLDAKVRNSVNMTRDSRSRSSSNSYLQPVIDSKIRTKANTSKDSRSRSSSASFLAAPIEIEFE